MATGERRLGSSARRGMTVLGKIPAVPKPINLPSQRLENRGLDPNVEIVPRGTFSWGTGRSPPTNSSAWGNVGLSSSPPVSAGAWNAASMKTQSGLENVSGGVAQNPPRPLSAGSTRPSSVGSTRPSSASATSGRAWMGAPKLDERLQPSHFSILASGEFPTLGSEKNPNLRPQQYSASLNRPTSADGTKERNSVCTGTSLNRPTSADSSKDRKPVYPDAGVALADRPTSADGSLVDQGRSQSAVVGCGTAGPGPGMHWQLKDDDNFYPPLIQHGTASPGSNLLPVGDMMHPGASQHDQYFNDPPALHSDVLVLPMDTRPGIYNNYPFDMGSNHFDRSGAHHPQSSWGPNHFNWSGIHQNHSPLARDSELMSRANHGIIQMEPLPYGKETGLQHEQDNRRDGYGTKTMMQHEHGNRRDGFNMTGKNSGEQQAGWAAQNVVYTGSSVDSREPLISTSGSVRELQKPDMYHTSWRHEPKHSGWPNIYSGDSSMGMRRGGAAASPKMYEQMSLQPVGPENRHWEESQTRGVGQGGDILHSVSSSISNHGRKGVAQVDSSVHPLGVSSTGKPSEISATGSTEMSGSSRQNVQLHKQDETVIDETMNAGPESIQKGHNTWVNQSPLPSSSKMKQEDENSRAKQSREPQNRSSASDVANQRQEDNLHGNLQTKHDIPIIDMGSQNGFTDAVKTTNAKKLTSISRRSMKGNVKDGLCSSRSHECGELHHASKLSASKDSEENCSTLSSAVFSTSSGKECTSDASPGARVFSDGDKGASADAGLDGVQGDLFTHTISQDASAADHKASMNSPTHSMPKDASASDHKAMPTAKSMAPVVESVAVPSLEEALDGDLNMKVRRDAHSLRRSHHYRPMRESHAMDKQHVNHNMVWAPVRTPLVVGATKEQNLPSIEKTGTCKESIQHMSTSDKPMQPLQKHQPSESQGQRHAQEVQEMQCTASSHLQAQEQRMQEHPVVSNKKLQQQLSRTSSHKESEQWVPQDQSMASSYRSCNPEMEQSVASSHLEQFASNGQREISVKEILPAKEQQEEAGGPIMDKIHVKKNKSESIIYVPRPKRNQKHHHQEQEHHDQRHRTSSQRSAKKGERSAVEDLGNQPSKISTPPVALSSKNNEEVKSHHSRFSKQQTKHQCESSASSNTGEQHVLTWKKPLLEEKGKQAIKPCLVLEPEGKQESKTYTRKPVRHQEIQNKQSAAGSHQEHSPTAEEHKKPFVQTCDSTSCESGTNKNEMKLYVQKHRKLNTHEQHSAITGYEGQKSQERSAEQVHTSNEKDWHQAHLPNEKDWHQAHLPNEKDWHDAQRSCVESDVEKDSIELYTPEPARQAHMQGHQSISRGHRRQRNIEMAEGQAIRSSLAHATADETPINKDKELTVPDSMECKDVWHSGNRDESKVLEYESSQGRKEVQLYVPKPARQQQSTHQQPVVNVYQTDVEVPSRDRTLQEQPHQISASEPGKRKEEIKRYTPKPARQQKSMETPVVLEAGKAARELGDMPLVEQEEHQRTENDGRANESEHGYKSRNHPRRSVSQLQMKTQLPFGDAIHNDHTSRVNETNMAVIFKDQHVKDRESSVFQKRGLRRRNHDTAESLPLEEAPKQNPKQHYQYQPMTQRLQTFKPQEEDDYELKVNTRQQNHGSNRFERRDGPPRRGRPHGYGYRAADHAG